MTYIEFIATLAVVALCFIGYMLHLIADELKQLGTMYADRKDDDGTGEGEA